MHISTGIQYDRQFEFLIYQFQLDNKIRYGEALFYTRLVVNRNNNSNSNDNEHFRFANVVIIQFFSSADDILLQLSFQTFPSCEITDEIQVINIRDIISVVSIIPYSHRLPSGATRASYFTMEKPGFGVSHFIGLQQGVGVQGEGKDEDNGND
jgi:hypothetical protein